MGDKENSTLSAKTEIEYAQEMTDWFPDFLYGVLDEPKRLPDVTKQRLKRQFGDGDAVEQIKVIRDALMMFEGEHQSNIALYFCGYPDDALAILADGEVGIERSVEVLDMAFVPPEAVVVEERLAEVVPIRTRSTAIRKTGAQATKSVMRRTNISPVPARLPADRDRDDTPLDWQSDALCAQTDPEAFFPEKGGSTRDAKRICNECDVRGQCLEYALSNDERFGIWGGLSERERRKLKRRGLTVDGAIVKHRQSSLPVEPFQRQFARTNHFMKLVDADQELEDMYADYPELMARTAYALLREVYPDQERSSLNSDKRRRLEAYFLDKNWNKFSEEFGGSGAYWDLLTKDLAEFTELVSSLQYEYGKSEPEISFAQYYLQQGQAYLAAGSLTSIRVDKKSRRHSENGDGETSQRSSMSANVY